MKASDYSILATSAQHREVAAYWRRQLADTESITSALIPNTGPPCDRRTIQVAPAPTAVAALHALATDDLGRLTVWTAGIALTLARHFNRPTVVMRAPLLADDASAPLNPEGEVPLAFDAAGDMTLRQFVHQAATTIEDSYGYQDFPVAMLAREEYGLDLGAACQFSQSSRVVHVAPLHTPAAIHFDLDNIAVGQVQITFDPTIVEPYLVTGLARTIEATLAYFANLSTRIDEVRRVTEAQAQLLTADWTATDTDFGPFASVPDLFDAQARLTPDAVAVRADHETLTYRELNQRANRLAHHLRATVDTETRPTVGIWMERSPWMVISVLGVLKAGLSYVPLETEWPRDRVDFLVRDARVALLLVNARTAAQTDLACPTLRADSVMDGPSNTPSVAIGPGDLAYVLYTSGSTGRPKGCAIEHHSLTNYLRWACQFYWTRPETGNTGLFTPLSFDLTVPSVFCPLLRGRTLVILPSDGPINELLRLQFAPGSTIDSIKLTPSHLRVLGGLGLRDTDIRLAIVGGEQLTEQQVAVLHAINPAIRVINEYGPTEATVGCIVKEVAPGEAITIGRPIANMRAYVLDQDLRLVPVGVRGEICIGGAGVARGYLDRPDLETDRFVPDPFVAGERLYRTGDIGRWLPSGELECFGRIDNQLKIRGYRIEPGEVEAALRHCEGVEDAVVTAEATEHGAAMVAYVVGASDLDTTALRRHLGAALPVYMIPAAIVRMGELPLTANGKVDHARLPASALVRSSRRPYVPPRTPHEEVLAGAWSEMFGLDAVGVTEDFFELGGHSLRAMTLMQRVHQALGLEVSIGEVLAHPTIEGLARLLESKVPSARASIEVIPKAEHYPVSDGQRRLWLIDRIDEGSPAYHVSSVFEVQGDLAIDALSESVDALVVRHEILRTVFVEVDDQPRQHILPTLSVPISYIDLRGHPAQAQRLQADIAAQTAEPFDLATGPLMRVSVFQMEESRATVALTLHHIITDAWSMRILMKDLIRLYEGFSTGAPPDLEALRIQYKDYAVWQQHELTGANVESHRQYWMTQLAGIGAPLDLPRDFEPPSAPTYRGRHHYATVSGESFARLRTLGARVGASPFMTWVALVKVLLHHYTDQTDIAIGTPMAGRLHPDLADQIGFYVNTLVLRDEMRPDEPFVDLLVRVKATAEHAYAHQIFPFDQLVEALDVDRDLSQSPLFNVMVVHDGAGDPGLRAHNLVVHERSSETGVSKFDLTFGFAETATGVEVEIEYATDVFEPGRIARMATHFLEVVDRVVADAGTPVSALRPGRLGPRRSGAPAPSPQTPAEAIAARTDTIAPSDERILVLFGALESVLGRTGVGAADNYFHVGGDSITAIQMVNRLARQGWHLRVRDVFEAPQLGNLAKRLTRVSTRERRGPVSGDVPLTPIQQWFFLTQPEERHHYNQSVMLRFAPRLEEGTLQHIGKALVAHHPALRLQFQKAQGGISQSYSAPYDPVEVHDLRDTANPPGELTRLATTAQSSLDLDQGHLMRLVLFRLPDGDRLLAIVHHLAVDGVSWRILLDDLRISLAQWSDGVASVRLTDTSDSFQTWAVAVAARAPEAAVEHEWWQSITQAPVVDLPGETTDRCGVDRPLEADAREQRISLSEAETESLLVQVPQAYNTRMQDVLLAALAAAVRTWAGPGAVRLDLETHGRDTLDHIDVSRTVGWFTTIYPVVLDLADEQDPGRQLVRVKEALRRTPGHGLGFGVTRAGAPSGAPILFNFLGQFDADTKGFEIAEEDRGPEFGRGIRMTHDLVVNGLIADGRLSMTVRYPDARFDHASIARLLETYRASLQSLIAHCRDQAAPVKTASDLRYADGSTDALLIRIGNDRVEDMYPLSSMQEGMLYHSVLADDSPVISPVYVEQFACTITGPLDVDAFQHAWDTVVRRHAALRTAFFWQDVVRPVQVVLSPVEVPWTLRDWRHLSEREQHDEFAAFSVRDRAAGFDLTRAPLSRFTLVRTADRGHRFYWTSHHLVLDGWSTAIVLQEVFACYQAMTSGAAVPDTTPRPFGDYIDWLSLQDRDSALDFWREMLHDFSVPTPLPLASVASGETDRFHAVEELTLSTDMSALITATVREHHLTLNTLARGVWALVLGESNQTSGLDDVVFGVTMSGRPTTLPEAETIVGLFINTVPVRIQIDRQARLVDWLHRLQVEHADLEQYAHSSLADIQRLSGVARRQPLFESLLVFENYPVDQSIDPAQSQLTIDDIGMAEQTNYPLTISVVPGDRLILRLAYDTSRYSEEAAQALLRHVYARMTALIDDPFQPVAAVHDSPAGTEPDQVQHRFALGASAQPAVNQLATLLDTTPAQVARTLAATLCVRYSANEELQWSVDGRYVSRDRFRDDHSLADVCRTLTSEGQDADRAVSDLAFVISETGGGPGVDVSSPAGRFGHPFLHRIEDQYLTLLAGVAATPTAPVSRLPLLSPDARGRILDGFNRTERDWGTERTIVQEFETHVAAHPDRVAVVVPALDRDDMEEDASWTYGELNARANQLARVLARDHGVGPNIRVGVLAERSLGMVLALLAVEKAGGAYVPFDPDYPRDLLTFMREDSDVAVVLTQERFSDLARMGDGPVICIDSDWDRMAQEDRGNLPSRVTGESAAYVIYTSGSTGRPKGAINTHRGIANRLRWMQEAYPLDESDRVLQKTPFSFDVSVWEFFWPLMVGARLVMAMPGGHRDAAYLVSLIDQAAITTIHFVPSMLLAFLSEPNLDRGHRLRRVICSGEALTTETLRRYLSRMRCPLHNLYGPTEAAVDVTAWTCRPVDVEAGVPIGRPIANLRLYILDGHLQPVPVGVTGELFLGGVGVGLGYLNRQELTDAKFIPDPFGGREDGDRLYRTGDLARYREDGVVDFLGRIDHQVKIRGFRIELGEIESTLITHAGIQECVVVVREDQVGSPQIVAYVVPVTGADVPSDVDHHLRQTLPSHMVPSFIVALAELPRLPNGKLNRKALPAPDPLGPKTGRHLAPRGNVERRLTRVWEDVLGHTGIGVADDFFDLGGHSLIAMKLVGAIQVEFGRSISLAQVLAHPTIERLATALQSNGTPDDWRPLVEIRQGTAAPPLFLLPGAGGNVVYFHALAQHLAPSRPVYALQAVGLDGRTPPMETIEAIASLNITEMRRVFPSGPYLLAGHSFGGRVALEMAHQLSRQGLEVGLLAILDTVAPEFDPMVVGADWQNAHWLFKVIGEIEGFFGIQLGVTLDDLLPLEPDEQLALVVARMQQSGVWPPGADREQLRGYVQVYKANSQAPFVYYKDDRRRFPIALMKAKEHEPDTSEMPEGLDVLRRQTAWGWDGFASGAVDVHEVPGAHVSMLAHPHVATLAQALDQALARSRSEGDT